MKWMKMEKPILEISLWQMTNFRPALKNQRKNQSAKGLPVHPRKLKEEEKEKNKAKKARTEDEDEEDPTDGMEDPTPENSITEVKVTPNNVGKADMQPQKGPGTYMDMDEAEIGANEKEELIWTWMKLRL